MPNDLDYAIVIGIEHYKDINPPLGGPHRDTEDFVRWLLDPKGGALPVDPADNGKSDNILKLLSAPNYTPLKDDIDDWLDQHMEELKSTGKKGRRLYFYFSGHGIGVTQMNSAMLLPKWTYSNRNYALSSEKYLEELVGLGIFQEIYFFMDCCRNRITGVKGLSPTFGAAAPAPTSSEYLIHYASEFEAFAYEASLGKMDGKLDNLLPRGLFTEVLLSGLRGAAADRDGKLKVSDLINYIKLRLPELALSKGKTQIARSTISIDLNKEITGPFEKTVDFTIQFKTDGIEMVLEDPNLNPVRSGNSSEGKWELSLVRGKHTLRKKKDTEGVLLSIDGTQNNYIYE